MFKTVRIPQADHDRYNLSEFPNAGPWPDVMGMKLKYWGKDALCVRCGNYVYKVDKETYIKCGGVI